jgi:hypothetical protein
MQQLAVIEYLTAVNIPLFSMHWQLKVVYGERVVASIMVDVGLHVFVLEYLNRFL